MLRLVNLWYIFCLVFALHKCTGVTEWLKLLNLPLGFFKVPNVSGFSYGRDLFLQLRSHGNIAVTSTMLTSRIFSPSSSGVLSCTKWLHSAFSDEQSLDVTPVKTQPLSLCPLRCFKVTRAKQQRCSKFGFPLLIRSSACVRSVALCFNRCVQKLFLSLLGLYIFSRLTDLSSMFYRGSR